MFEVCKSLIVDIREEIFTKYMFSFNRSPQFRKIPTRISCRIKTSTVTP